MRAWDLHYQIVANIDAKALRSLSGLLSLGVHLGMQSTLLTRRLGIPPSAPGFFPLGREIVVLVLHVVALVVIVVVVVAVAVVVKVAVARVVVVVEVIQVVVSLHWQEQDNFHTLIEVRKLFACICQCLIQELEETSKKFADPDENMIVSLSLPVRRDDNYYVSSVFCKIRGVVALALVVVVGVVVVVVPALVVVVEVVVGVVVAVFLWLLLYM